MTPQRVREIRTLLTEQGWEKPICKVVEECLETIGTLTRRLDIAVSNRENAEKALQDALRKLSQ